MFTDKTYLAFWEHLEELRWVLMRTIIALLVLMIGGFFFMPYIFQHIVLAPCNADFVLYRGLCRVSTLLPVLPDFCDNSFHVSIINIKLASQFFTHMTTSFWLAFILACPYLVFEIWRFISPALYSSEKKGVRRAFVFGTLMFFAGCTLGYYVIFPMTLRFLAGYQLSSNITNQISLDSYMDNFIMLIIIMGLVFELPVISWALSKIGLVSKSAFCRYRRHAIVILLIAAAIITPSGDPFTLSVVFIPLYMLYELSCMLVSDPRPTDDEELDEIR